jgi:hypothetical protein
MIRHVVAWKLAAEDEEGKVAAAAAIGVRRGRSNLSRRIPEPRHKVHIKECVRHQHRTASPDMLQKMLQVPAALWGELKCLVYLPF